MAGGIQQYGAGNMAIAIVFIFCLVMFGVLIKIVTDNSKAHRKEMIPVLQALRTSIDGLTETQAAVRNLLVEKFNETNHQMATMATVLAAHTEDCKRKELIANEIRTSALKTEERTKACSAPRLREGI